MATFSKGYWIDRNGIIVDVSMSKHIAFIISNPELFGYSKKDLYEIYQKHAERMGLEGRQREEIILSVYKLGWIRIRYYDRNDLWSIQCDNYKVRKKIIDRFIEIGVYGESIIKGYDIFKNDFEIKERVNGLINQESKISIMDLENVICKNEKVRNYIENSILVESIEEKVQFIYTSDSYDKIQIDYVQDI